MTPIVPRQPSLLRSGLATTNRWQLLCCTLASMMLGNVSLLAAEKSETPIVVEAESFQQQRLDEKRQWHVLQQGGELAGAGEREAWTAADSSAAASASNHKFVRLLPDTRRTHDDKLIRGENFSPQPGKMAILSYRVTIGQPGRYYVWVRAFSTGTEDNGIHVGLNGQWPEHGQRMQWCKGKGQWTWGCAQRTEQNHCGEPMEIYLDIDQAGEHTIEFSMREDGFAFDQFLLTRDQAFRP